MLKSKKVVNSEYRFVRCLGEGLSSTVYEAVRSNASGIQSERVAVKVLKSENSVSWLQNEFETLRKVNSSGCVRVLGHESFDEGPALILEFIDGVTLYELGQAYLLQDDEISEIGAQVEGGLRAIAAAGSAHGDLNPKNILLTASGEVKLIDFGSFADASEIIGSTPYISKHIWRGERASFESDLASWGLIAGDLQTQFRDLPFDESEAKARAFNLMDSPGLCSSKVAQRTIAAKVVQLHSAKSIPIETAIISKPKSVLSCKIRENRIFKASVLFIALALLFPAQNLLSEPLKAAEVPQAPAVIMVRTHDWTEVSVNGVSKGYAPINLHNLGPGKYRIKYKRQRGQGELVLLLNPGQKRLLKDADFKY